MRLEHYPTEKLKKEILETVGKYLNLIDYRVFFFGSRVSGGGNKYSDVDVGIEGTRPVPPEALAKIREAMENLPTLYKIEVVDFKTASGDFLNVALRSIESIIAR